MLPLREYFHQTLRLQPLQVRAGGRGRNAGDDREFGAGSCPSVHQATEHTGAGRLTDGRGNRGDGGVGVGAFDIHSSMVDELLMHDN